MTRLSVLMPVYNAASTVSLAVTSTLRALDSGDELIIMNDGSTDSTAKVLKEIQDPRVQVLSQPNAGVSGALESLLAVARGDLVARMDADDVCLPWRFRHQLKAMRSGLDVVFSTVIASRGRKLPVPPKLENVSAAAFPFQLLLTNPVAHSTMLARRQVLVAVGGYRQLPTEDYDLWLRIAANGGRMQRIAFPGLVYRFHPGQVTATAGWRRASWENPGIAESFSNLAERLLGVPATRITALSIDEELSQSAKLQKFDEFAVRFSAAIESLSPRDRRRLIHKLGERRKWLSSQLSREA